MILEGDKVLTPPDFDGSKIDAWQEDDAKILASLKASKKILDFNNLEFFVMGLRKKVSFSELLEENKKVIPQTDYRQALIKAFSELPDKMDKLLTELNNQVKDMLGNREEVYTYLARVYNFNQVLMKKYLQLEKKHQVLEVKLAAAGVEMSEPEKEEEPKKEEPDDDDDDDDLDIL